MCYRHKNCIPRIGRVYGERKSDTGYVLPSWTLNFVPAKYKTSAAPWSGAGKATEGFSEICGRVDTGEDLDKVDNRLENRKGIHKQDSYLKKTEAVLHDQEKRPEGFLF